MCSDSNLSNRLWTVQMPLTCFLDAAVLGMLFKKHYKKFKKVVFKNHMEVQKLYAIEFSVVNRALLIC